GELAVLAGRLLDGPGQRGVVVHVRGAQRAADRRDIILGDDAGIVAGLKGDDRPIVGTGDGDGYGALRAVRAGDVKGFGDVLADVQFVEGAVGNERPGAVCRQAEGAVFARMLGDGLEAVVLAVDISAGQRAGEGEHLISLIDGLAQ